jgi:hypothetical protein
MGVLAGSKVPHACSLLLDTMGLWMGARCDGNFLALAMEKVNASLNIVHNLFGVYIYELSILID